MKYFKVFRFDEVSGMLWEEARPKRITKKAAELLRYFLEYPGVMLSHHQIMRRIWPDTHVQPQNIKTLVHQLRVALGDDPNHPRYIRADAGRGYTFLADATDAPVPLAESLMSGTADSLIVGRARERAVLDRALAQASSLSAPQIVVIEGERGWGKTTLCQLVSERARRELGARVSLGQALEIRGAVEPYGVLADALTVLSRQYPIVVPTVLERDAPAWRHRTHLSSAVAQVGRELARVLEDLSQDVPLILILEDLQWSDLPTIEWLRAMAHRRVPSRVMMIATCNRSEADRTGDELDRLMHDLDAEARGHVLRLAPLGETDVVDYVTQRFGAPIARLIGQSLSHATGGSPALMVSALDTLVSVGKLRLTTSGWRLEDAAPIADVVGTSLVSGLLSQIDRLHSGDRSLLEAAALVGVRFTPAAIAEMLAGESSDDVDRRLSALSHRQLLIQAMGANGRAGQSIAPGYEFRHPVLVELLRPTSATRWRFPVRHDNPVAQRA